MGTWFLLGLMKMFWNWIVVMVVEPCEYTKTHQMVHLKMMNFMACEPHFNSNNNNNSTAALRVQVPGSPISPEKLPSMVTVLSAPSNTSRESQFCSVTKLTT